MNTQHQYTKPRPDLINQGISVPVGDGFYDRPDALPYRWVNEIDFQVFYDGKWQDAVSTDWVSVRKFYALWDNQCNRRMATGCNCTTKGEVKRQLWSYYEPDRKEIFLTDNIRKVTLQLLLDVGEFTLEESDVPFDEEF